MDQLWTIIFVAAAVAAFAVASLHDREERKRKERRAAALEERSRDGVSFHAGSIKGGGEEAAGAGEELSVGEDERQAAHTRG
jgi:hypothetical protein